jgi:hypothetical protein
VDLRTKGRIELSGLAIGIPLIERGDLVEEQDIISIKFINTGRLAAKFLLSFY